MKAIDARVNSEQAPQAGSTDGRTIYAVGDIQGRYDLLATLLEAIVADLAGQPQGVAPLLIFCGGSIDHGPESDKVLSALVWLARHAPAEVRVLQGSHERALLDFIDRPETLPAWVNLGGAATLRAFGVDVPEAGDAAALASTRDALADRLPASHLALLRAAPTQTGSGDYAFSHAVRPCRKKMLVHGNGDGSASPQLTSARTGIDTAAFRSGILTAVRLDGTAVEFLQTGGEPVAVPIAAPAPQNREVTTMREALARFRPEY